MNKKFYKNEKFQIWFFPILYFLLAVSIVITGCFTFKKVYYQPIVVTGTSMWPTLAGGNCVRSEGGINYSSRYHYGYADLHRSSVNELKRFDVVVTYYPRSWNTETDPRIVDDKTYYLYRSFKIKRVWGFPGETISLNFENDKYTFKAMKNGVLQYVITSSPVKTYKTSFEFSAPSQNDYTYKYFELNFQVFEFALSHKIFRVSYETPSNTSSHIKRTFTKTLAADEYFVMGDNFQGSTDCYEKSSVQKLTSEYVQGRVICINSFTTYRTSNTYDNHSIEGMYDF